MENYKCLFCGGDLIWGDDHSACDSSSLYEEGDTAIVSNYTCSKCGRTYEIYEPNQEERDNDYKDYWHGKSV